MKVSSNARSLPGARVVSRPVWTGFRGWSFLFDNPGASLRQRQGVSVVTCSPREDPALTFYSRLVDALDAIGLHSLDNAYSLVRVEAASTHVTVLDGHNEENLGEIDPPAHGTVAEFLKALPESIVRPPENLIDPVGFEGILSEDRPLRFKFERLSNWEDKVLVARLIPADDLSVSLLDALRRRRAELDEGFIAQGRKPLGEYKPHCTLGYFTDEQAARLSRPHLDDWSKVFQKRTGDAVIEFTSIAPYCFLDMETFAKR